jgi:hypothetical protein
MNLSARNAQAGTNPGGAWQRELFDLTTEQKFEVWKDSHGGRHVLRIAYAIAAPYAARYRRTGRKVSMKLIWELMRDRMDAIVARCARRGIRVRAFDGFALNNVFTAHVARHIMGHRTDWAGMFETREMGVVRRKRKVVVIEERV